VDLPEPAQRLAPSARSVWRIHWALASIVALIAGGSVRQELPGVLGTLAWALPLASLVAGTPLVPAWRWSRWRWEVREREIDLRRGTLVLRRTLIPMARVQHVETERGPLEQFFELATVEIHTAAGAHKIPLLSDYDAGMLRSRIAELARTADG
jgi:membrane protein YdbS with pleckstrin-like domain